MSNGKTLIVIVGPTASGKTALSIKIAQRFKTEIISADSRQFFREMNIGTAKPTKVEMGEVLHHFVNSHSINEDYNIGEFESDVLETLDEIFLKNDIAVMVGGSGLYVKVVCEGMDEMPDTDPEVRVELQRQLAEKGLDGLLKELEAADPDFFKQVDQANSQRVMRAIEVYRSTGVPYSYFRKGEKKERPFNIIKIGLLWDRVELYNRIDQRMDEMISNGLFEEAQNLYSFKEKNALQTVGYKEIFDWMDGKYDKDEAVRLLKRNSRRYAKRQMTWFKKDQEISWFNSKDEEAINSFIEEKKNR